MKEIIGLLGVLAIGVVLPWQARTLAAQATYTVNSTGDGGDANTADGICDDGTFNCTLRAAIEQANASAGKDRIEFNIPATDAGCNAARGGVCTVQPAQFLPLITDPVIIDGYTQAGASPNTNQPESGTNAVLMIELDGSNAGASADGLVLTTPNSTIRGLVINQFDGVGVLIEGTGGNTIAGNYIGTNCRKGPPPRTCRHARPRAVCPRDRDRGRAHPFPHPAAPRLRRGGFFPLPRQVLRQAIRGG